jgi:hypothetical protein
MRSLINLRLGIVTSIVVDVERTYEVDQDGYQRRQRGVVE